MNYVMRPRKSLLSATVLRLAEGVVVGSSGRPEACGATALGSEVSRERLPFVRCLRCFVCGSAMKASAANAGQPVRALDRLVDDINPA